MTRVTLFLALLEVAFSQDLTVPIPPVKTSIEAGNQPVTIIASGIVTRDRQAVRVNLSADLSDFQIHITDILRERLNRSDRCGERLSVERATIQPATPAAALTASVHYEKWACVKAFGKHITKRLIGGNATIPVRLTPVVSENRAVKLAGEVGQIQADGSLGDALRAGSFGDALQQKIQESILAALDRGANLHAALPESVAAVCQIRRAAFVDSGAGRLSFEVAGDIALPFEQIRAMMEHK